QKRCLIDEYDRVHRDFKGFYQLAAENATFFQDMIDRAQRALEIKEAEIATVVVQDGEVTDMIGMFSRWLPNITFFLNGKDGPRIAFNFREAGARQSAYFNFFAHKSGCEVALDANGFKDSANNFSGFLIDAAKPAFTTDLYPTFSMATISPCFADILYPTSYYYDRTFWSGQFAFPDNYTWTQKKSLLYWRGMGSGGLIIGENYHCFPRYRLMHIGWANPELMDVRITSVSDVYCRNDHEASCDRAKSTIFEEYFNDWIRPFEHFVPVRPDLSDLIEKIEWANANPREAQLIQRRGQEVAWRVITDDQNDCYMYAASIEWAQLQDYARAGASQFIL
ncbi:hypothetical protein K438DRAFT_1810909, partial [Mycena galopus ATCC 62051]